MWLPSLACGGGTGSGKAVVGDFSARSDSANWHWLGATSQAPFMSDREYLLAEIRGLQDQIGVISLRLSELVAEVNSISEYELVEVPETPKPTRVAHCKAKAFPTPTTRHSGVGSSVSAAVVSDTAREDAARATGRFFARCLAGEPRGSSGRSLVRLQNHFYVVIQTIHGDQHLDPVLVFDSYSRVKPLVCNPISGGFGSSIFAGFNAVWEARLAVAEAGLGWPQSSH